MDMRRGSRIAAGLLGALALAACSGSPPTLDGVLAPAAPPQPALADKQAPSPVGADASPVTARSREAAQGPQTITGFKKTSVILYSSPTGADGQRVASASMPLPLAVRSEAASSKRLEIMTLGGLRWVARGDVVLAEAAQR
jgi:hypothetical protein